jgi:hypothetical protein
MKIRVADSTGCPVPQFVVEAENETDQIILRAFCGFPDYTKDKWEFTFSGATHGDHGVSAFNFGWKRDSSSERS